MRLEVLGQLNCPSPLRVTALKAKTYVDLNQLQ
jgi:hypothetical protein